jgi:ATP-dependent RNA helicase DDX54/DBP10
MPPVKRKRSESVSSEEWESDNGGSSSAGELSDDDMDISSALTGKRPRREPRPVDDIDDEDDEDLNNFIKATISKRDVKEGTQVVKKAKGKAKVAKGEVGGGSFQSMGTPTEF